MLRFFRDTRDGESIIYDAAKSILSSRRGDAVVNRTSTCFTADDRLSLTNWRELPPAEFLRATRGTAIADKALELLAAERGVVSAICGDTYFIQNDKSQAFFGQGGWFRGVPNKFVPSELIDLPTILASDPGKKHREQIEAFILGLPVAKDEPKERTLLDVVRDVTDAGMCGRYQHALSSHTGTLAGFEQFFVTHVDDEADADNWISTYLNVDRGNYSTVRYYKLAIARRLGLVADEPQAEAVKRVRCWVRTNDSYAFVTTESKAWGVNLAGGVFESTRYMNHQAGAIDLIELSIPDFRQKYANTPIIAKLDELLRETGEYVEPEPERGDYLVQYHDSCDDINVFLDVTEAEAIARVRKEVASFAEDGEPNTLALRPLGPAILTLRSVEKTTFEVEEVKP